MAFLQLYVKIFQFIYVLEILLRLAFYLFIFQEFSTRLKKKKEVSGIFSEKREENFLVRKYKNR